MPETVDKCCLTGFTWTGTPVGTIGTLADNKAYITGTIKHVAILVIHDIFGWEFPNTRLLADHFAREVGATVFVPDFFGGERLPWSLPLNDDGIEKLQATGELAAFLGRNSRATAVQLLAPERDRASDAALKAHALATLQERGVAFQYRHFPGVEHACLIRGHERKEGEKEAMVKGKNAAVAWYREWLHGVEEEE